MAGKKPAHDKQASEAGTFYRKTAKSTSKPGDLISRLNAAIPATGAPDEAFSFVVQLSLIAATEQAAQGLLDARELALTAMLGCVASTNNGELTEDQSLLASAFFDMGMKAGIILENYRIEIEGASIRGSNSVYRPHAAFIISLLDECIAGNKIHKVAISEIKEKVGEGPSHSTLSDWIRKRKNNLPIWN